MQTGGSGVGVGKEPYFTTARRLAPLYNHSILSVIAALLGSKHNKALSLSSVSLKGGRKCIHCILVHYTSIIFGL